MTEQMTNALQVIEQNVRQRELLEDFDAIQMARTPEVLRKFVVGAQAMDHPAQGWAQCVLELQIKYDNIRRAKINAELIQIEIDDLEKAGDPKSLLNAKLKRIDLEAQDRAMLGAIREFQSLYAIYKSFDKRYTRDELPYTTAVVIDQFEDPDREGGLTKIYASILVENESQKPIVIGRGGSMIKEIGTSARQELERYLDTKVFLDLHVKVRAEWRDDERALDELGVQR